MTYMLLLNFALKLVEEIILYYNARSKKHKKTSKKKMSFNCKMFKKSIIVSCHLKTPEWICTGEHAYSCDVCNKLFTYQSILKNHECLLTGGMST